MSDLVLGTSVRSPLDSMTSPVSVPTGKASLGDAAKQFEGMMMAQVFQTMRKTVQHSGLFGDSAMARSTYEYLLDQAVVQHAMDGGKGWGLAERLEESWKASSEKNPTPA